MTIPEVPAERVSAVNDLPVRLDGQHVLYWMIAQRRARWSHGLQHAVWHAQQLGLPLVVLEALRIGYPWASARLHRFVMDGMADNRRRFAATPVAYHAYVEPAAGAGAGLLEALAARAAVVVTDEFPAFFLPRMVRAAGRKLGVRLEQVDDNGILPLRATPGAFPTAYAFRRFLQKTALPHLAALPVAEPLAFAATLPQAALEPDIAARWPEISEAVLEGQDAAWLDGLDIDQRVRPVPYRGGSEAAERALRVFLERRLARYDERNQPDLDVASGLSPYLHFGHIAAHEVVASVLAREGWHPSRVAPKPNGSREGFWGVGPQAEGFLDELITWREVGYAFAHHRPDDYDRYESLPDWAQETLAEHEADPRPVLYTREQLDRAETHDPLWNAAQRQLRAEGRIHNYLRMLWGKKILEWSPTPRDALDTLIALNNRYAVDGRNPNSYSGIFWTLGRFDRAWGPERPIFGKIRYMSSDNTARKLRLDLYLARWGR